MERERWIALYRLANELSRSWRYGHRYSAAFIVGVFLWAVCHDRRVSWACQPENWPKEEPFPRLPSQSTMSRRLRSGPVKDLLNLMENHIKVITSPPAEEARTLVIDAKPLPIGGATKDPDARYGRAVSGFAMGYKLYAVWGRAAVPETRAIAPMNVHEATLAKELIPQLSGPGFLLGDAIYGFNHLFDFSFEHQFRLIAPRHRKGKYGHGYLSPLRRLSAEFLEGGGYTAFHKVRSDIERQFGNCTSFAGGLAPLPSWVRRLHRVQLWVQAKILINAARILHRRLANA
jgi:hypothetical protein